MLKDLLQPFHIILASSSPRRHEFLKSFGLDFEIRLKPVEEIFPETLTASEITDYLAILKATPFLDELKPKDILITSDTIVWHQNKALGKPKDDNDAYRMIASLSGSTHEVISSICFTTPSGQKVVNTTTEVTMTRFTDEEIWHYIKTCNPLDKAGAYGIQEWIGTIGITHIKGSYNNVVGLPTHLLYQTLKTFVKAE